MTLQGSTELRSAAQVNGKELSASANRILIVRLSAIGDVLMATPVARALRKAFPQSYIAWVVEKKAADIVIGNPYLDDVIVWERTRGRSVASRVLNFAKGLWFLRNELRSRDFDVCLDLQGLLRSALVCWLSGAARRIGFADGAEGSVLFYNDRYEPGNSCLLYT
ncbi:MAG: glycosyltransferase family 9 protein, partial [Armatimonadetes bacterium]|nr:glycosyltransferase family 9 protein [Armatimonadota bacterium]